MSKVYVGDIGTVVKLDTGQPLAGATALSIDARRPDGSAVNLTATIVETTKVMITTDSATFTQPGDWRLQAHVTMPTGEWRGETVALTVYPVFG
jgi:hypothetical protein